MKNIEGGDELDEEDFQPTPKEYIEQGGIVMLNDPSDETIEEEDLQPELTDEQVREIMEKIQGKPVERNDKVETVVRKAMAKKRKGRQRTAVVWKKRVKPEEDKPKDVTKATSPRIKEGDRVKVVDGPLKGCECEVKQVRGDRAEVIELNSGMSITLPVSYLST
jgi:SHS2 domain-containing protein